MHIQEVFSRFSDSPSMVAMVGPPYDHPCFGEFRAGRRHSEPPLQEREVDRNIAEALAARAVRIAFAVLGNQEQSLVFVSRAAESVRQEGITGLVYEMHLLRALVVQLRAMTGDQAGEPSAATAGGERDAPISFDPQRLCIDERIVLALCSIGGLSYGSAAHVVGVSKSELLERLAAARRRLWETRS